MPSEPTIEEILREIEESRFYGALEIKFEKGIPVILKKSQNIKPSTHRNYRGESSENR